MLCSLNICDFVIVDKLDLEFSDGFTALTGETGAGKSILIDALQLLFGARSDPEVIRSGAQKSDLTASFTINDKIKTWLEERELSGLNGELVLRRTLDIKGRSRSWINGTTCSLSQLKELSHMLVVVHGQHAHQSLLRKGSQLEMLDAYSGLRPQVDAVRSAWTQWREAQKTLEEARERQAFNQAELERMKWFLEDMKELSPIKGEWARINEEHTRLSRYNDIIDSCQKAREALTEADYSALELVDSAIIAIGDVSDVDAKLEKIYTQLNDAREIIDSASDDVEHYLDRTDFDEGRFEELDQRINLYLELARKYHVEPEELYAEMQKVSEKAAEMEGLSDLTALFNKAHKAKTQYDKLAGELSKERKKGALKMQKSITDVMQTLAMAGGSFEVAVTPAEAPSSVGIDHCEFLVAGHAGVPRRSLSKVASGGE
ncbi:DNA repair protein RecN, partial [Parasutterella excrementihominis]|uniref:DNA repair protein RecN n=1 Tax=Parasutterella excrementihominis TaxID=487175 RepID=UPI00272DDEF0